MTMTLRGYETTETVTHLPGDRYRRKGMEYVLLRAADNGLLVCVNLTTGRDAVLRPSEVDGPFRSLALGGQ